MEHEDFENVLKVIVVGNGEVGKTSMITRFATGQFTGQYKKTIGTDFMEREIEIPSSGESVKLMLWDTAGQEMFSELTKNYYRGAGAVVYVFSTIDHTSFDAIERWRSKVKEECEGNIAEVLVQNKIDLLSQAKVSSSEAEALAEKMSLKLYRVCVKDNMMVADVFQYLAEKHMSDATDAEEGIVPKKAAKQDIDGDGSNSSKSDVQPGEKFKLKPSRQRTGGKKKSWSCNI